MIDVSNIEIYLIRHAQCEANKSGIISGPLDDSLTEAGIIQAKKLRESLSKKNVKFDRIYTSTAKRTIDTARIISPDLIPSKHHELLEINIGPYENENQKAFCIQDFIIAPFPGGESYYDLYGRASKFFDKIVLTPENKRKKIGIIAHGGSIGVIIHHIIQDKKLIHFPFFELSNASLTHITINTTEKKYFFHTINSVLFHE